MEKVIILTMAHGTGDTVEVACFSTSSRSSIYAWGEVGGYFLFSIILNYYYYTIIYAACKSLKQLHIIYTFIYDITKTSKFVNVKLQQLQ